MGWPKTTENKRRKEQEYYCFYYFPRSLVLLFSIVSGQLCLFTPSTHKNQNSFFFYFLAQKTVSLSLAQPSHRAL